MAYRVWCTRWDTGELADTTVFQPIKFNSNIVLRAIRAVVVVVDNPTFTDLNMKIYSSRNNSPQKLLHTSSNSITKAQLHTADNGVKECYFQFADPSLEADTTYQLVINGTGYTPTATSLLAWKHAFPENIYASDSLVDNVKAGLIERQVAVIASVIK